MRGVLLYIFSYLCPDNPFRQMKKNRKYLDPRTEWSALDTLELICDSYSSGIDDMEYEDVDWTVNP